MHNSAERGYQIVRVVELAVGIVDDAALLVLGDPVAVDEPLQRCTSIYHVFVRRCRNTRKANVIINDERGLRFVGKPHLARTDLVVLLLRLSAANKNHFERIFPAPLIAKMQLRQRTPSLRKSAKVLRKWNARQLLR